MALPHFHTMPKYHNMVESIILIKNSPYTRKHFLSIDYIIEEDFGKMIEENCIDVLLEGDFLSMIRQFKLNILFGDESELGLEGIHNIFDVKGYVIKRFKTHLDLIDINSNDNNILVKFKVFGYDVEFI